MSRLRSYAPLFVKRLFWNGRYRTATIDAALAPQRLVDFPISCLPPNGAMLDLGCGPGNLCASLHAHGWAGHFTGVDVSDRSIKSAKKLATQQSEWYVSPIEKFDDVDSLGRRKFDVICLCESIYYVRIDLISGLLSRCEQLLVAKGMIVIRITDAIRHGEYVEVLRKCGATCNHPLYVIRGQHHR